MPSRARVILRNDAARTAAEVRAQSAFRVKKAGFLFHELVTKNLRGLRSGREYPHPQRTRANQGVYRASTRQEYPAYRTGRLFRSIRTRTTRNRQGVFMRIGSLGLKPAYGRFLEQRLPIRGGRPFLRRTFRENERRIRRALLFGR